MFSVGNLSMGGRGKTPVAAYLAQLLVDAGERPAILSRGYKRRRPEEGAVIVSDGRHLRADLDRSGDEPLMLARAVPGASVVVCDVRAVAAALAERTLGATVHVLDDGFQHRSLRKDAEIVVVAPRDLSDRRVPFGRLRSPVSALARADVVIVDDDDPDGRAPEALVGTAIDPSRTAVFSLRRTVGSPVRLEPERPFPAARGPVVALAGIAAPARFAAALRAAGWHVVEELSYPDHHAYGRRDLARIAAAVRDRGATAVLTTEKDAVRLLSLRPLPVPIAAVPLQIAIEPSDRFREWVLTALREARP